MTKGVMCNVMEMGKIFNNLTWSNFHTKKIIMYSVILEWRQILYKEISEEWALIYNNDLLNQ